MIVPELLCSGLPGVQFDGKIPCPNLAQVRLAPPQTDRAMCVDCAEKFDRRCKRVGVATPQYYLLEGRWRDDAVTGGTITGSHECPPSREHVHFTPSPPDLTKGGGSKCDRCEGEKHDGPCCSVIRADGKRCGCTGIGHVRHTPEVTKGGGSGHSHCACTGLERVPIDGYECRCGHHVSHHDGGPARVCWLSANRCFQCLEAAERERSPTLTKGGGSPPCVCVKKPADPAGPHEARCFAGCGECGMAGDHLSGCSCVAFKRARVR